jgi:hypothetical protein
MNILREYIRETLLAEAAKGVDDLTEWDYVRVIKDGSLVEFSIRMDADDGEWTPPIGNLLIVKGHAAGDCLDAWMVANAAAKDGWGPMLYDIAMEWATEYGGGLMSDRSSVSKDAYGVWDYYKNNRPDVEKEQLDMPQDWFENGPQDDCKQGSTWTWLARTDGDEEKWTKVPLSKVYKKPGMKTINALKAVGKFREEERR